MKYEAIAFGRVKSENIVKREGLHRDKKTITARYTADNFDKAFTIASRPGTHRHPRTAAQPPP
jgi:hypothetical protein